MSVKEVEVEEILDDIAKRRQETDGINNIFDLVDENNSSKISTLQTIISMLASIVISVFVVSTNWVTMTNELSALQNDTRRIEENLKKMEHLVNRLKEDHSNKSSSFYAEFLILKTAVDERSTSSRNDINELKQNNITLMNENTKLRLELSHLQQRVDYLDRNK